MCSASALIVAGLLLTLLQVSGATGQPEPQPAAQPADPPPPKPRITSDSRLPNGTVGQPYSFTFLALGGEPPYRLWVVESGNLAPGLELDPMTGEISGTPTTFGVYELQVSIKDKAGTRVAGRFSLRVNGDPLEVHDMPAPLFDGTVDPDGEYGGTAPFRFPLVGGGQARAYIRQHGHMLTIGFIIGETFYSLNNVRVLIGRPGLTHLRSFVLTPFNPADGRGHSVASIVKRPMVGNRDVSWLSDRNDDKFAGLADAIKKDAWHAEIRINLEKALWGDWPEYLHIAFGVGDGNSIITYSPNGDRSDNAVWLERGSWHRLTSTDAWGQRNGSLLTPAEIDAIEQQRKLLHDAIFDVKSSLAEAERKVDEARSKWSELKNDTEFAPRQTALIIDKYDANRDLKITLAEWLAEKGAESEFNSIDADGDGSLTMAEVASAMAMRHQRALGSAETTYNALLKAARTARDDYVTRVKLIIDLDRSYYANYYGLVYDVARRYAQMAQELPGGVKAEDIWNEAYRFAEGTRLLNQHFRPAKILVGLAQLRLGQHRASNMKAAATSNARSACTGSWRSSTRMTPPLVWRRRAWNCGRSPTD